MYHSKSVVRRSLTALLALLMVIGSFTVGVLAEDTIELKLKTFTGQQLYGAAESVGTTNEEGMQIYTSYQDAIGRRSLMPDNWMLHSMNVPHLSNTGEALYNDGDELRVVIRLSADDSYTSGDLILYEFAYDATLGRDDLIANSTIDYDTYETAATHVDETTGVTYKEFEFVYLLNHTDFDDTEKTGQLRVQGKNQSSVTVYFMGVYNETANGATVVEYDGIGISAQGGIDGYYENVYPEDGAISGVASYASDHEKATGRDWNFAPYCFNAYGANRENPYLLLSGLGAELPAGDYALDIEMSTMIALITTDKCEITVNDGDGTVLTSLVITEEMVNAAAGKDTGAYAVYRLNFTVPEESAGNNITFRIFLFDSNDIKFRNISLYKCNVTGTIPDDAKAVQDQINALTPGDSEAIQAARNAFEQLDIVGQAWVGEDAVKRLTSLEEVGDVIDAIAALGDVSAVNKDNYTQFTEALENAEALYNAFVAAYGEEEAATLVTNAQALTDFRTAYDAAKAEAGQQDEEAAAAVDEAINALPAVKELAKTDQSTVEAARDAYDALTDAQKELVSASTLSVLEAAEARMALLVAASDEDIAAAKAVDDMIDALPAVDELEYADKADVDAARAAYDALTEAQKGLVLELAALEDAEEAIADLAPDVTYGDINDDGNIDASDALEALQHSVELKTLEGDALTAADVTNDGTVDAADALNILQYSVELIDHFPVEE